MVFFPGENDDDDIQYNNSFIYFYNWNRLVINKNQSINHIDKQNCQRINNNKKNPSIDILSLSRMNDKIWWWLLFFVFFFGVNLSKVSVFVFLQIWIIECWKIHTQHKLLKCNYHYHTHINISDYYTTDDHDSNLLPFLSCLLDCLLLHIWQQTVQNWIYHLICICIMDCIEWINHATFFYFLIFVLFSQTNKQHAQQQQQSNKQNKKIFFHVSHFIHSSIHQCLETITIIVIFPFTYNHSETIKWW